jgi:predicted glycosyltransferase
MRRIAFYSYDEQGLGHVRRSVAIARAVSTARPASTAMLLIAGAREAGLLRLPAGTDTLALPAPTTDFTGGRRRPSLGLDVEGTVRVRARALRSALAAYRPHALVVDRLPLGVHDELGESVGTLREMGTRLVLGLRDVLDDPAHVAAEWERSDAIAVLRRSYDAIWAYGDPRVYDAAAEYRLPADVRALVRHTGYLARRPAAADAEALRRELRLPAGRLAVCLLGGGDDGAALAQAFAGAVLPDRTSGVLVTGPFMGRRARADVRAIARGRDDLVIRRFVPDASGLAALADDVVAMGGYNTTCEILAAGARALVVPRTAPSREQLIRARRLAALGAIDVLEPTALSAGALSAWLARGGGAGRSREVAIDLDGLDRVPALLDEVLAAPEPRSRRRRPAGDARRFHREPAQPEALPRGVSA